jgi:uncharacterized protein (UPF0216 family)
MQSFVLVHSRDLEDLIENKEPEVGRKKLERHTVAGLGLEEERHMLEHHKVPGVVLAEEDIGVLVRREPEALHMVVEELHMPERRKVLGVVLAEEDIGVLDHRELDLSLEGILLEAPVHMELAM